MGRYSQNDEDIQVIELAKAMGLESPRFLDIGAHNGVGFSNSRALYEDGWGGAVVECSPRPLTDLLRLYRNDPRVEVWGCPVSVHGEQLLMHDSDGEYLSTSDPAHAEKWAEVMKSGGYQFSAYRTASVSMATLLSHYDDGRQFDFVNIDVEGQSCHLCHEAAPLFRQRTRIVCVEKDEGHVLQLLDRMQHNGFKVAHESGENLIFTR